MKQDARTGLYVPDTIETPKPESGGWPPKLNIPDDAKTSKMELHVEGWSGKMWGERGDRSEPGRMPK